jgi:ribosomal subunit interface protein
MTFRVSGKNMDVGEALRTRIEDVVEGAVTKYFDGGYSGHVNMEKQGGLFKADCVVHLDTGILLQAKGEAGDAHAAFDASAERIEKRLRRYKRRLKDHHAGENNAAQEMADAAYMVMSSPEKEEEIATDYAPAIIAESSKKVSTQTVAMAVMELDLKDEPVHLFKNAASGAINVVYRREDGNIGWIDPATASTN